MLPRTSSIGIEAELIFYDEYKDLYKLVPSLDCGDKTDLSGLINDKPARIDVTTNFDFKKEKKPDYEQYIIQGWTFWIVEVNPKTKECRFLPLHFPRCNFCEEPLYNLVYLEPHNSIPYSTEYVSVVQVCLQCEDYNELSDYNWVTPMFAGFGFLYEYELDLINSRTLSKEEENLISKSISKEWEKVITETGNSISSLIRKEHNAPIAYVGQPEFVPLDYKTLEGYTHTNVYWKNHWAPDIDEIQYCSGGDVTDPR